MAAQATQVAQVAQVAQKATLAPVPRDAAPQADAGARLFARLAPAVYTVRTVASGTGRTVSQGSAFAVNGQGWLVTNHHVVATRLAAPTHHQLRVRGAQGQDLPARVLAIDVVRDLALLAVDAPTPAHLPLPALDVPLAVGSALYSLGNPRDMGTTLMGGHYSGRIRSLEVEHIHFSGSVNPGMSGGPVVDAAGRLVGVNVQRRTQDEQIGLLVPAAAVRALVSQARAGGPHDAAGAGIESAAQFHAQATAQLQDWQARLRGRLDGARWPRTAFGPYQLPDLLPDDLACHASHNHADRDEPGVLGQRVQCANAGSMDLDDDASTGRVVYSRVHLSAGTLGAVPFARLVQQAAQRGLAHGPGRAMAQQRCQDHTTRAGPDGQLPVRLLWCADAYRDLPGLYDIEVALATQDRHDQAAVLRLKLEGVAWSTGMAYTRYLLEGMQ